MDMKKIMIMGASSGIGLEMALLYIAEGNIVGVSARRKDELEALKSIAPDRVFCKQIDVLDEEAPCKANELIEEMGGMDLYFHSSGIGFANDTLDSKLEIDTVKVNTLGFTNMIDWAMNYFESKGKGHIVAISSVAGTRGLAPAPAYSASKSYQQKYLEALSQRRYTKGLDICITDIRPGFVDTPLLKQQKYPMLMQVKDVALSIHRAIKAKKRVKTIDFRYNLLVKAWKLLPSCIYERLPLK